MNEPLYELKSSSRESIISIIGDNTWEHLDSLTRTGVLTAELCLRTFSESPTDVDFSASVMPIMKALENELVKNFYVPYADYLKRKHPQPDDYIQINNLTSLNLAPQDARRKIIGYNSLNKKYWYRNPYNPKKQNIEFTIGDFQYTAGVDKLSLLRCDATVVEFYKQVFGPGAEDSRVTSWVCKLTQELESLRQLRNDSAHAGKTQSLQNAVDAMNVIIKVDHILMMVSTPSLS